MPDEETLLETSRFNVVRCTRRLPNGNLDVREVVRHPGAVTIIPLIDDEHVCLIRNVRTSVDRTLIELPAGTLEAGEDPAETARRELTEETGYTARRFEPLSKFFTSPGVFDEQMHVFVAHDLTPGSKNLDDTEQIENLVVSWDEALALADGGQIEDGKTLAALYAYDRIRRRTK